MVTMGNNESLFEGIVFVVAVVVICAFQWVRSSIEQAGHRLLVKSKVALGV